MSLAILFHFSCAQHVSDINISIIRSLRLFCWITTLVVLFLQAEASACNTDTTQTQPHQISNTQRTKNKTTDVVIQQHSRKLLMMATLMSETCWAHEKWNKIASDIKLVFFSSAITMTHAPIDIRFKLLFRIFSYRHEICLSGSLREEYRLMIFDKTAPRRIFSSKRDKVNRKL